MTFDQVGLRASSKSAMKTFAPEFRALIIIFGSAGPVISTRRSSRSAGAGATRQSPARTSAVAGRKSGSRPAAISAWRAVRRRSSACRSPLNRRSRSATKATARGRQDTLQAGDRRASELDPRREDGHDADRRTVASMRPWGSDVATKISSRFAPAERREVDRPVVEVRQGHPDLVDLGVALQHRVGHDPDRVLDRLAVVLREDLEQRGRDRRVAGVPVAGRAGVAPGRRDLRGHDPVVRLGEGRVAVAGEAHEGRLRRLHDDEILQARLDDRGLPGRRHARGPGGVAGALEGVGRGPAGAGDRRPAVLADADGRPADLREGQEVGREDRPERLDRAGEVLRRQGVDGVLHRVGRDDQGVVAGRVGGREVTFEGDIHGEVTDPVAARIADDLDEPDRLLAVRVRAELDHAGTSPTSWGSGKGAVRRGRVSRVRRRPAHRGRSVIRRPRSRLPSRRRRQPGGVPRWRPRKDQSRRPRRRARPGVAPVCSPSSITSTPFTST